MNTIIKYFANFCIFTGIILTSFLPYSEAMGKSIKYGFPIQYNQNKNETIIHPGATLSTINGFKIPIKIGVKDYFIGEYSDLKKFFKSHADFQIIAQTLQDNGKWIDNGNQHVNLIIQNVGKSAEELLTSYIQEKIVGLVVSGAGNIFGEARSLLSILGSAAESGIYDILDSGKSAYDKTKEIHNFFNNLKKKNGYVVSRNSRLIVSLSAYAPPSTRSKLAIDLGSSTISMTQLYDAFYQALH